MYALKTMRLMKEIEEDNKWKDIPCWWIRRILLKCPYYPKSSRDTMQSLWKSNSIIYRNRKNNPKIHMETQNTQNNQSNLEKD